MEKEAESPNFEGSFEPRSRRMGMRAPPDGFNLENSEDDISIVTSSPPTPSDPHTPHTPLTPPVPARSPLRPPSKSVASFTTFLEHYTNRDTYTEDSTEPMPLRSVPSLTALLDAYAIGSPLVASPIDDEHWSDATVISNEKTLPTLPTSDSAIDLTTKSLTTPVISSSSSFSLLTIHSTTTTLVPSMSKRDHALNELLSSERAYASDLAFIRDVHLPLALGQSTDIQVSSPITPSRSSGSSSRTPSTSSDSSTSSSALGAPMTPEDVKIIFGNISELAIFSNNLSERIEKALGSVLDGGKGEDHVGQLFVEVIPIMEPLYKTYITRHPTALIQLNSLPQTPALTAYLTQTKHLATSLTHAWDLPSLLIKPVQRLLKYSLLLRTIIEDTADGHGDKNNLRKARDQMEEVAREVNEERRRLEIVREILTGKSESPHSKKKNLTVKTPVISLGRMKSLKILRSKDAGNEELERIERADQRLKECDAFARAFARSVSKWSKAVKLSIEQLDTWAQEFGKVIGLSTDQPSDSFNAFIEVIKDQLLPLCIGLDEMVNKDLFPKLARVLKTANAPTRLLQAMHSLEPMHESLLNLNYSKSRPPTALLEASQSYIALRAQLNAELPKYLELLDKGVLACIGFFTYRQAAFWSEIRDRWGILWDALRMDGEGNLGSEETLRAWWARFSEVDEHIAGLSMLKPEKFHPRAVHAQSLSTVSSLGSPFYQVPPLPGSSTASLATSTSSKNRSLASLDTASKKSTDSYLSSESFSTRRSKSRTYVSEENGHRRARSNTSPPSSSTSLTYPHRDSSEPRRGRQDHQFTEYDGQIPRSPSLKRRLSETLRPGLRRSSSSQRSVPTSPHSSPPPPIPSSHHFNPLLLNISRKSPALYRVRVVHPCIPPDGAEYLSIPFFELRKDDIYQVLSEAGHPSTHEELPLYVDDGEDCLLVVRNSKSDIGWVLASFTIPM